MGCTNAKPAVTAPVVAPAYVSAAPVAAAAAEAKEAPAAAAAAAEAEEPGPAQQILSALGLSTRGAAAKKVAIVSTSASSLEGHPTGLWLEEVASPYYIFLEAGYEVDIVSVAGGEPPVDAGSRGDGFYTEEAKKFDADPVAQAKFKASKKLEDIEAVYSCLYLAGGHGTCVDFPNNKVLIAMIEKMYAEGKVVAADCHGPVALLNCKKPNGEPLVKGLDVTGFSNTEENTVQHMDKCRKLDVVIEDKFKELGGNYSKADDWNSKVCAAGNLVTGQNPQSSKECALKCVKLMKAMIARGPTPAPGSGRSSWVAFGGLVWTVGFPAGKTPEDSVAVQTEKTLANLDERLKQAGTDKSRIVEATVYLKDMATKDEMDAVWRAWVPEGCGPSRACVGADLAPGDLVEMKITAALP